MDRIERLERSFMESDRWLETRRTAQRVVEVTVQHRMPDDEEARRRMASAIQRNPMLRRRVEADVALREGIEARVRYPEAYL